MIIRHILLYCVFPISVGVGIYAFLRPSSAYAVRSIIQSPHWITFNLPDALWLFSLLSCIQVVWGKGRSLEKALWLSGVVLAALLTEPLQYFHIIPGTCDAWDVLSYILATFTNLVIFRQQL